MSFYMTHLTLVSNFEINGQVEKSVTQIWLIFNEIQKQIAKLITIQKHLFMWFHHTCVMPTQILKFEACNAYITFLNLRNVTPVQLLKFEACNVTSFELWNLRHVI